MPGDTTVSKSDYQNVKAVMDQIQEANSGSDKKLFVKRRLFGKNELEVKSTGTSRAKRLISALKRREAKDQDILKALKGAAKNDIGELGPKAVDRYLDQHQASLKSETLAADVNQSADSIARAVKFKEQMVETLQDLGFEKPNAEQMANAIYSDHGCFPTQSSKMLKNQVTTNILAAFADEKCSGEDIRFLMDYKKAAEIIHELEQQKCDTPDAQRAVDAKKHAVYDFLIDHYLLDPSNRLNLQGKVKKMAADCPIGQGTYNDQALQKKGELVNAMAPEAYKNATGTNKVLSNALVKTVKNMTMEEISEPMTEHWDGDPFLSLKLAEAEAQNRTGVLKYEFNPDGGESMPDWANQSAPSAPKINKVLNVNPATPQSQANPTTPKAQGDATPSDRTDSTPPKAQSAATQTASKPDKMQANSDDVSSTSQSEKKPEKDSLDTPLSKKFDHFLQSTPKVISEKIRNHPNLTKLSYDDMQNIEKIINNPTSTEFDVAIYAEKLLNGNTRTDTAPPTQADSTTPKVQGAATQTASKPDKMQTNSDDVSSTSQSEKKPEKDSLGTPMSKKFDHFLQSTPKVISEKIRNHQNLAKLSYDDMQNIEKIIDNPASTEFDVAIYAEKLLNRK